MTKSAEAFRTISEAAAELDVPQHVLRFWESKFGQIRPMKRGGGRRYYRPSDLDLLRGVRALLYDEGYTIKGVQKLFRERGAKYIADLGRGDAETPSPEVEPKPASGAASGLSSRQEKAIEKALSRLEALKTSLDRTLAKDDARQPRGDAGKQAKKAAG